MRKPTGKPKPTGALPLTPRGTVVGGALRLLFLPVWLVYISAKAAIQYFLNAPRVIQVIMAVTLLGLTGVGGLAVKRYLFQRRQTNLNMLSVEFNSAAVESDEAKMLVALEKFLQQQPDDDFTKARIEAVKTGIASPDDSVMCMLMARVHARHKRNAEATREAHKRLVQEPQDWLCNCIVAQDLIQKGELEKARVHLDRVANVDKAIVKPNLGMILHAIELRNLAGLDNTDLRSFIVARVMPNFRNANLEQVKPEGKIQIIYTYASSILAMPESSLDTGLQYWAVVSRLGELLVPDAKAEANVAVLKQFGSLMVEMQNVVFRFQKTGKIDKATADQMYAEVDARGFAAWQAVRELKNDDPSGFAGSASYLIKAGKMDLAEEIVVEGINRCGPHPELLRLLIVVDERKDRPERALQFALAVARKYPDNVNVWRVLIDAAKLANRRDIAIQACVEMRKARPGLAFADMAEGILRLEAGNPHQALACLKRVDDKLRSSEPAIAQAYAKALIQSGNDVLVPEFVKKVIDQAELNDQPMLALACIRGCCDTEPTPARADFQIQYLDRLLAKWPSIRELTGEAQRLRAKALFAAAELATPRWEPQKLERALRTYESLVFEYATDENFRSRLAMLQLHGLKKPEIAALTVEPLARIANPSLEARTILGAVAVATNKPAEAIAALEPIIRTPQVSGEVLTLLARAYLSQGDSLRAKAMIARASQLQMNDRERDEYRATALAISRE